MSGKCLVLVFLVICKVSSVFSANKHFGGKPFHYVYDKPMDRDIAEDAMLDVIGLLTKYGYPSETHRVVTEDGYIVTMHRITGTKGEIATQQSLAKKPAVLLMHGFLSSSSDWIVTGPRKALGYLLADEGFDVWMGNARGNYYSRNHTWLNPDDSKFWKFSWDEIGFYDLPAMIDEILRHTDKETLHYVGHSQGTTTFFVMASRRPNYNNKIKSMQALSPVAYMSNLFSPLFKILAPHVKLLTALSGDGEILPHDDLRTIGVGWVCKDGSEYQRLCSLITFLLSGFDAELQNTTILPVLLGHAFAGSSIRQFIHYAQEFNSGKFSRYDYGTLTNFLKYGKLQPPNYSLSLVSTPVFLHYSENDWLSDVSDVIRLYNELGNAVEMFKVPFYKFNHFDFLWAKDVRPLLYNRVIKCMKWYE